ncbi:MAG: hypothetical protein WED83_03545 [Acidimicrobiia bacterium]
MSHRLFFFNKVADGVSVEEAEQFLRSEDLPLGRSLGSFTDYTLTRLEGTIEEPKPLPCEFIDIADVTSLDDYKDEISRLESESEDWARFVAKFDKHFSATTALYGTQVK